eukprot:CAMPEP_0185766538 /NCGR_PEP_ID=MMETSP1174-20130828/38212_1 /TAXON_ID=35687 /ORGANISM="Dictyocha speculum, Strain CCMP1381" /LENGTH=157 /DNA_ID=CAMNT_0028450275 /DNA_START=26 /DNA_END=499 /DNA_ORIENTATION=+
MMMLSKVMLYIALIGCSQAYNPSARGPAEAFRFGSDARVVGYRGGNGMGMGELEPARDFTASLRDQADEFRYGASRTIVGYRGGVGKGLDADEPRPVNFQETLRSPTDEFRFGSSRTEIGYRGGNGKGMGEGFVEPTSQYKLLSRGVAPRPLPAAPQ